MYIADIWSAELQARVCVSADVCHLTPKRCMLRAALGVQ